MRVPTHPVVKWRGLDISRKTNDEDENISKAERLRRKRMGVKFGPTWFSRHLRRLISTPNTREVDGNTTLPAEVEIRQFKWLLTALLLPAEYHHLPLPECRHAPWRILMRCFLVDLPGEVQDAAEPMPWRQHPVGPLMPVSWVRIPHVHMDVVSWGYRAVFSQELRDKSRSLTGSWLVVIYITAGDRKWLAKADERTLVTPNNLYNITAFERSQEKADNNGDYMWSDFWQNKQNKICQAISPTGRGKSGFTTKDADERRRIGDLLDGNASKLLFGAPFERPWSNDSSHGAGNRVEAPQVSSEVVRK